MSAGPRLSRPLRVRNRRLVFAAMCCLFSSSLLLGGDEGPAEIGETRAARLRAEFLRIARLLKDPLVGPELPEPPLSVDWRDVLYDYPTWRIRVRHSYLLEMQFHPETLEILKIHREGAMIPARPPDGAERVPLTTLKPAEAASQARKAVEALLGSFPSGVDLRRCEPAMGQGHTAGEWSLQWLRLHRGYLVPDGLSSEWNERLGIVFFKQSFGTVIETDEPKLTEAEALTKAREAVPRVMKKFSGAAFGRRLEEFTLGEQIACPSLTGKDFFTELCIVHPNPPLQDTFKSFADWLAPVPQRGRLAYPFSFRMVGPDRGLDRKVFDKELTLWIDAVNGEVIKMMF